MAVLVQSRGAINPCPLIAGEFWTRRGDSCLRPDGLDAWQLLFALEGEGRLEHSDKKVVIRPGEMVLFAPGVKQNYGNFTSPLWKHLAFIFHAAPQWQRWLKWPEISPGIGFIHPTAEKPEVRHYLSLALGTLTGRHHYRIDLAIEYLHLALIYCAEYISTPKKEIDHRIVRLLGEVEMDMKKSHLSTAEMARRVGLSVSQLGRYFESQLRMRPVRFFENLRLEKAAELLRTTSKQIQEISEMVGYDDSFYFSSRFRAKMGISPRLYRQHWAWQKDHVQGHGQEHELTPDATAEAVPTPELEKVPKPKRTAKQ